MNLEQNLSVFADVEQLVELWQERRYHARELHRCTAGIRDICARHGVRAHRPRWLATGVAIGLLFLAFVAKADVPLAWDASLTPGVTNYVLYASTNVLTSTNLASAPVRVNVGTNLTARVSDLLPGQWYFAVTVEKGGVQSDPSNVLPVEVPASPGTLRTVALQYSATLTNGFQDLLFLKLRVP